MPIAPPPSADAALETHVFWLRFKREIVAALVVVLSGIIGFAGYRLYLIRRDSAAAELLGSAKSIQDYVQVISLYPSAPAGASAYLLLAEKQRNEKKLAEANATLRAFIDKNLEHELVPTAQMAIAANLESMGKHDEALSTYQQVAATYSTNYNAPLALVSEVPLLKAKNRIEDARRVCEEILTKYRMPGDQREGVQDDRIESIWAVEAMRQLRSLKPPEQPNPAAAGPPAVPAMLAAPSATPAAVPPASAPTPKKRK